MVLPGQRHSSLALSGRGQLVLARGRWGVQVLEELPGHRGGVLTAAAADDEGREGEVAAVAGEPSVRAVVDLRLTGLTAAGLDRYGDVRARPRCRSSPRPAS